MNMGIYMLLTGEYERMFNLDLQLLFDSGLTLVAIFVMFLVASNFLFNPARKVLEDRKNRIADDLESAANDKAEALKLKEEYEAKLKEADKEVERILSEARKKAVDNENKIVSAAHEEAKGIVARAGEEAELEKKRVMNEVKKEMVDIASLMASKVVRENINTEIQDSLVEETLKEIGDATWQS